MRVKGASEDRVSLRYFGLFLFMHEETGRVYNADPDQP